MAWEVIYGICAAGLLCALVYGMIAYKTRNKANDRITEAATREEYRHPARYAAGGREALKRKLR